MPLSPLTLGSQSVPFSQCLPALSIRSWCAEADLKLAEDSSIHLRIHLSGWEAGPCHPLGWIRLTFTIPLLMPQLTIPIHFLSLLVKSTHKWSFLFWTGNFAPKQNSFFLKPGKITKRGERWFIYQHSPSKTVAETRLLRRRVLLKEETAAVILLRNTRLFKSLFKSVFVPGEGGF